MLLISCLGNPTEGSPMAESSNKMAYLNKEEGDTVITTGMHLKVLVEFAVESIITVYTKHNNIEYRGVLLECNKGFFPHGIPFTKLPKNETNIVKKDPDKTKENAETENMPPLHEQVEQNKTETSASVCRFSYETNPFLVNPRPVPEVPVVEMKPVFPRTKSRVRDIRLRPRQTLCSNCKSSIHDNGKNSTSSHAQKHLQGSFIKLSSECKTRSSVFHANGIHNDSSHMRHASMRKRKGSFQTPMVLLEDIKKKSSKLSDSYTPKKNLSNGPGIQINRIPPLKYSSGSDSSIGKHEGHCVTRYKDNTNDTLSPPSVVNYGNNASDWLQLIDSEDTKSSNRGDKKERLITCIPKPSPAIKISIGDVPILNIPPRLPDSDQQLIKNENMAIDEDKRNGTIQSQCYQAYKKAKKSSKKAKDREKHRSLCEAESSSSMKLNSSYDTISKGQKKHKKKHKHRHQSPCYPEQCDVPNFPPSWDSNNFEDLSHPLSSQKEEYQSNGYTTPVEDSVKKENYENENTSPTLEDGKRPRLLYTWKQNKGLSRVLSSPSSLSLNLSPKYILKTSPSVLPVGSSPHRRKNASPARVVTGSPNWHFASSPNRMLKDYPLRSKSTSTFPSSHSPEELLRNNQGFPPASEDSQSQSSGMDSHVSDFEEYSGEDRSSDELSEDATLQDDNDNIEKGHIKPLMMKIQTQDVSGCVLEEGREVRVGDIVWGKIQGFPWWPGRVSGITVTQRDNDVVITQLANVAWFGSNTMSHVHCCELFPFLQEFKARHNKKKKGQYRIAIKQATVAAQMLAAESKQAIDFENFDL